MYNHWTDVKLICILELPSRTEEARTSAHLCASGSAYLKTLRAEVREEGTFETHDRTSGWNITARLSRILALHMLQAAAGVPVLCCASLVPIRSSNSAFEETVVH